MIMKQVSTAIYQILNVGIRVCNYLTASLLLIQIPLLTLIRLKLKKKIKQNVIGSCLFLLLKLVISLSCAMSIKISKQVCIP